MVSRRSSSERKMRGMAGTLTPAMGIKRAAAAQAPVPALYVALYCERPTAPPSRHLLAGVDRVLLGRAESREEIRRAKELSLAVVDPWMSQRHATLRLSGARWIVEDAGSRNGTFVNG